jgi:hypothetical protein
MDYPILEYDPDPEAMIEPSRVVRLQDALESRLICFFREVVELVIARFRDVILGQVLYAGDGLSGEEWDNRGWQSRSNVRWSLFWLSAEACLEL